MMLQVLELFLYNYNSHWNEGQDLEDLFLSYCC